MVTGRDLVIKPGNAAATTQPVIFADPNYDLNPDTVQAATRAVLGGKPWAGDEAFRGLAASRSLGSLRHVPRLSRHGGRGRGHHAQAGGLLRHAPVVYQDQFALKAVFKELHSPKVAVLSTHGFFLADQETKHDQRGAENDQTRSVALTNEGKSWENPLLRCGLLLAGCNEGRKAKRATTGC